MSKMPKVPLVPPKVTLQRSISQRLYKFYLCTCSEHRTYIKLNAIQCYINNDNNNKNDDNGI